MWKSWASKLSENTEDKETKAQQLLMHIQSAIELSETPKVEDAVLQSLDISPVNGSACLTGHHLIFYCHDETNKEHWILHKNVDFIEKRFTLERNVIVLKCKDFKQFCLTIPTQEDAINVATTIENLSSITKPMFQYPFFYRPNFKFEEDGYDLFCMEHKFVSLSKKSDNWRVSTVNMHFKICPTYPSQIIVPKLIDDTVLIKSAQFRQGGRFPMLCYYHTNGRVIMRCSQPLTGPNNKRCKDDEKLINIILGASHRGYIMDTRSNQVATQAKSKGGGFETSFNYPQWRKLHGDLQKFNIQQESFIRIVEASLDLSSSSEKWQSKLESSNWMSHVKDTLSTACLVAQCVDREGASVLIHGDIGLDSTLQITTLTQVILDPDSRTLRGFLRLVDKEWIQGGHPFTDRCFHSVFNNAKQKSEGSSFIVVFDCVHQLMKQFPLSFEFNESLLITLIQHSYASQFGTFLCNSEKERREFKVRTKTVSLWSYLLSDNILPGLINPLFQPRTGAIWPSVAPQSLQFWEGFFLPTLDNTSEVNQVVKETIDNVQKLQSELSELSKEIAILEAMEVSDCAEIKDLSITE